MRLALVQYAPVGNAPEANAARILALYREAAEQGAALAVFPELALTDADAGALLGRNDYRKRCAAAVRELAAASGECGLVFGAPLEDGEGRIYNCLLFAAGGELLHCHQQLLLPFDAAGRDRRYFSPGSELSLVEFRGEKIGLLCGEDARAIPGWPAALRYRINPAALLADQGATLLVNGSAFPFRAGKGADRRAMGTYHSARHDLTFVNCNLVSACIPDLFDGASYLLSRTGRECHLPPFAEALRLVDTEEPETTAARPDGPELIREALVFGIREAFRRSGCREASLVREKTVATALCRELAAAALGDALVTKAAGPDPFLLSSQSCTELLLHPATAGFAPLGDLDAGGIRALDGAGTCAALPLPGEGAEDQVLTMLLRGGLSPEELAGLGHDAGQLNALLRRAEHNRRHPAPGVLRIHAEGTLPPPLPENT